MKRSGIRDSGIHTFPDSAARHPGYLLKGLFTTENTEDTELMQYKTPCSPWLVS
jgi:hypothetical protein